MRRRNSSDALIHAGWDAASGFIAGLVASFCMNQTMRLAALVAGAKPPRTPARDPQRTKLDVASLVKHWQEKGDPTGELSERLAERFGIRLSQHQKKIAGPVVHYAFGAMMGAVYGSAADGMPWLTRGRGVPFGVALWLAGDEIALPAAGLGPKPTETPLQVHLAMLASHLVYGAVLESVRQGLAA